MSWISEDMITILIAAGLGGVIGLEREINGKAAGLRTNILICVGAAIFTMLSVRMAEGFSQGSPTRIAAQIVSGVGFLGAGAIIQDRGGIQGLTTAAGIWLVASIGVACGAHKYMLACETTFLAVTALIILHPVTHHIQRWNMRRFKKRKDFLRLKREASEAKKEDNKDKE